MNGSGKHNNWSLTTDDGINLLDPGKTPHENVQFLLVLTCVLKAVDRHAALLRESAADVGNDHRLGANEAPPAIISVYLGEQLEDVLAQLISTGEATHSLKGGHLHTGVRTLPDFAKDATDRNRTSPFAFTGNKFEFRMVGSRDSVAEPNVVLNTIVAEAFSEACDVLEQTEDFDMTVHDLIKKYASEHQRIVFNGNGYSDEWVEEAKRRGLPNIKTMVDAIPVLTEEKTVKLFENFGVFTRAELESRAEIQYETYSKAINIEARSMIDIASKHIIPAVLQYTTALASSVNQIREACAEANISVQIELLKECSSLKALVLLVDSRLPPQALDINLVEYAQGLGLAIIPVLTKSDKCRQRELNARIAEWTGLAKRRPVVTSAAQRRGMANLWNALLEHMGISDRVGLAEGEVADRRPAQKAAGKEDA